MKVKWLGHAAFLITSASGKRIITDPYTNNPNLNYQPIRESANVVTVSHEHGDHNNVASVSGNPQVINTAGTHKVGDIEFRGIPTYHDASKGSQRGANILFCFTIDDIKICHLGDLGHDLSDEQMAELRAVDILLIPVGGSFTIDAKAAAKICDEIRPRVAIPMHFKNDKCAFPIAGVEDFLQGRPNVSRFEGSEVEFAKENLPPATTTLVLRHAL